MSNGYEYDGIYYDSFDKWLDYIIEKLDLAIPPTKDIEDYIDIVIQENTKSIDDYKRGNKKAINALFGKVMKKFKGAETDTVKLLLEGRLNAVETISKT